MSRLWYAMEHPSPGMLKKGVSRSLALVPPRNVCMCARACARSHCACLQRDMLQLTSNTHHCKGVQPMGVYKVKVDNIVPRSPLARYIQVLASRELRPLALMQKGARVERALVQQGADIAWMQQARGTTQQAG